jgi:hypothetical protein
MSHRTEELLRAGMERFTAEVSVPAGLAVKAAKRGRRRRRARAGAAVLSAASIAGAVAVVVAAPGPVRDARMTAYVVSRAEAALAQASSQNVIEYVRETATGTGEIFVGNLPGRTVVSWTYGGRQDRIAVYASSGQPAGEEGSVTAGRQRTITSVSYRDKTWWRQTDTLPPAVAPTPESSCEDATVLAGGAAGSGSARIRAALSCGQYSIAGTGWVDGVRALRLKPTQASSSRHLTAVLWVDASTYLPVRDVVTVAGTSARYQDDFRWLRPTPANLANLKVPIPAGFTQVPPPAG